MYSINILISKKKTFYEVYRMRIQFDFFWKNVFLFWKKNADASQLVFVGVGLPLIYFNPNTMSNPEAGEETEPAAAEFIKGTTKNNYRIAESVVKRWMQLQLKSWDWFIPSFQQLAPLIYGLVGNISGNFHTTGSLPEIRWSWCTLDLQKLAKWSVVVDFLMVG